MTSLGEPCCALEPADPRHTAAEVCDEPWRDTLPMFALPAALAGAEVWTSGSESERPGPLALKLRFQRLYAAFVLFWVRAVFTAANPCMASQQTFSTGDAKTLECRVAT